MAGIKNTSIQVRIGSMILILVIVVAVFCPILAPYDPYEMGLPLRKPSPEHILGTNDIGQDIFSELLFGTRVSLLIGVISAAVVTIVGTALGIIAGYMGGKADRFINQLINVVMSLPSLPLTIVLVAFLNANIWNIVLTICITSWAPTARIIRSRVQQIRELPFVRSEQTMGAGSLYIMYKHIMPNIFDVVFIQGVLAVGDAMLTEASLSFLGLGVIGHKSWGGILHYAFFHKGIINGYYWWFLPPIICICLSVLGFMLLSYHRNDGNPNAKKLKAVSK